MTRTGSRRPALSVLLSRGLPVGRIAGAAIVIAPSWFAASAVLAVLLLPVLPRAADRAGWVDVGIAISVAVLLGVAILVHELGHCLVARHFGIKVPEIRLYAIGGVSELERPPATAREEAAIAAAGPVSSAALAGLCWLVAVTAPDGSIGALLGWVLALANAIVAIFNVLPALPLDGGRVVRAAIWAMFRRERPGTVAGVIGGFLLAFGLVAWTVVGFLDDRVTPLQAVIFVAVALFVASGAAMEWPRTDVADQERATVTPVPPLGEGHHDTSGPDSLE